MTHRPRDAWLADAALIRIGGPCNTRPVGVVHRDSEPRAAHEVEHDLEHARRLGVPNVVLVGGEPLARRDLPALLQSVRRANLRCGIATNGRMLVYPAIRTLLRRAGVDYSRVELHGASAAIHDPIVGVSGAFEQTWAGLAALLRETHVGLRIEVACTVVPANIGALDAWVRALDALPRTAPMTLRLVAQLATSAQEPWADAAHVTRAVTSALQTAAAAGLDATWEGFAPCLIPTFANAREESLRRGAPALSPASVGTSIPVETPLDRTYPFPCQECALQASCPGAPAGLIVHDGEDALRPTRSLRANSFNFELVRDTGPLHPNPAGCPAKDIPTQSAPARSLFLLHDESATLYCSPTSDFTDGEVHRIKDELEQVYVDVSEGAAIGNYTGKVRRVRAHAACRACPDRASCGAAWIAEPNLPFEREEHVVREHLARMRGRVLDVGCGDQLYRDLVGGLIARGEIEYHGLDTDDAALARLRESGIGGALHATDIESFRWEGDPFDHVLILRSFNHLHDLRGAFEVLTGLMRAGGSLLICDAPAFAMLRTPEQVRFADGNAPVGHEHYRNWTSHQVVAFLDRFPLRVRSHHPVDRHTDNQWVVEAVREVRT